MKRHMKALTAIPLAGVLLLAACSSPGQEADNNDADAASGGETNDADATSGGETNDADAASGGEITVALGAAPQSFDPLASVSGGDYSYFYLVYDTLIEMDEDANAAPGLAESWDIPDDTTIVLNLRSDIEFHDGTPFDAEAVKWNLERANSEGSNTRDLSSIESIDVVDEHTVQLNLSQPDASIPLVLSDRPGTMISPAAFEELGEDYHLNPVGTGAFEVVEHISNESVRYEKNEDYWKDGVSLDAITITVMGDENTVINAMRAGQVHVASAGPAALAAFAEDSDFTIEVSDQLVYTQLLLNTGIAPLDNPKVREAISHAIDKAGINEALTGGLGKVAHQSFPEGYSAYNPNISIEYDPELSRQLLAESGVPADQLKIDILFFGGVGTWPALAEATAAQLRDVGFTVELVPLEVTAALAEWGQNGAHAALFTWSGRNDPLQTLSTLYGATGASNQGKTSPDGMEEMLESARTTYDSAERAEIFKEISALAADYHYHVVYNFIPRTQVFASNIGGMESHFVKKPDYSTLFLKD
nr:ABC transporter substrate-binding protein [Ornithinimicrobium cryptoxanthini]